MNPWGAKHAGSIPTGGHMGADVFLNCCRLGLKRILFLLDNFYQQITLYATLMLSHLIPAQLRRSDDKLLTQGTQTDVSAWVVVMRYLYTRRNLHAFAENYIRAMFVFSTQVYQNYLEFPRQHASRSRIQFRIQYRPRTL